MKRRYGSPPVPLGAFRRDLQEVMYYLYLPVKMAGDNGLRLPENVAVCRPMIEAAFDHAVSRGDHHMTAYYVYLSARKGWATPDNPLNRPGWHCDGFGTDDRNYVWWRGPGTRFALQEFEHIDHDHVRSLEQFERQVRESAIFTYPEQTLYAIDPFVVHATPLIPPPGCWRQYVKVSVSTHRYNLENNSHNYLFDYHWPLTPREDVRNDTHAAQRDYP